MMDNFSEQLVKKMPTSSDRVRKFALIFVGLVLTTALLLISILFIGTIITILGFLLAGGTAYLIFSSVQAMDVEYEYAFTNGELDIDKIIAKKKRKELISADVKSFTAFGPYNEDIPETDDMVVVICSDNIASHEYYADLTHSEYGNTRIIFSPNEDMLENINKFLPRTLRKRS